MMLPYILFAAPIVLFVIIGALIRRRGNPETTGRRYFLFLIWTTIGSLAFMLLNWMFPRSVFVFVGTLFPILPGLTVLTLLHWREWDSLQRRTKVPILSAVSILLALTVPCDSPFLPADLFSRLNDKLQGNDLAVAKTGDQPHPVFSLVRVSVLEHLSKFLSAGGRKIDAWYSTLGVIEVAFDDEAEAFRNINTREELNSA